MTNLTLLNNKLGLLSRLRNRNITLKIFVIPKLWEFRQRYRAYTDGRVPVQFKGNWHLSPGILKLFRGRTSEWNVTVFSYIKKW